MARWHQNFTTSQNPYTLLTYGQWFANKPKGETILKVLHTQNINKNINFGFYYNSIGSAGQIPEPGGERPQRWVFLKR